MGDRPYKELIPNIITNSVKIGFRLILVLRTRVVHIQPRINLGPNVYALAFCVYAATPLIKIHFAISYISNGWFDCGVDNMRPRPRVNFNELSISTVSNLENVREITLWTI